MNSDSNQFILLFQCQPNTLILPIIMNCQQGNNVVESTVNTALWGLRDFIQRFTWTPVWLGFISIQFTEIRTVLGHRSIYQIHITVLVIKCQSKHDTTCDADDSNSHLINYLYIILSHELTSSRSPRIYGFQTRRNFRLLWFYEIDLKRFYSTFHWCNIQWKREKWNIRTNIF